MLRGTGAAGAPGKRRSARVAEIAERACCVLAPLPHAVVLHVFALLSVEDRARCAQVARAWRAFVAETAVWARLDLSLRSGLAPRATDAYLRAAAGRAAGTLMALDVTDAEALSEEALLEVVAANGGSLRELRVARSALWPEQRDSAQLAALLAAAPALRLLESSARCRHDEAPALLRRAPPFALLHLRGLAVDFTDGDAHDFALELNAAAALPTAPSRVALRGAALAAPDALVAALGQPHGAVLLMLQSCALSHASLAALLSAPRSRLAELAVWGDRAPLADVAGVGALAAALRSNAHLASLTLAHCDLWGAHDGLTGATLLAALTGHPTLRQLVLHGNSAVARRDAAGTALGALLAADAPALTDLDVAACNLQTPGLQPLLAALRTNTHLRKLDVSWNMHVGADAALLPAVRANRSLRELVATHIDDDVGAAAVALVARRAAAAQARH
jgi:hypothetical protein